MTSYQFTIDLPHPDGCSDVQITGSADVAFSTNGPEPTCGVHLEVDFQLRGIFADAICSECGRAFSAPFFDQHVRDYLLRHRAEDIVETCLEAFHE